MLFLKAINSCCKDVVQNKPYFINKCCNHTNYSIKMFNLNVAIHVLTPKLAGWRPMQKLYKKCFLFLKECGRPYDFCREAGKVSRTYCVHIVHPRTTIFGN